MTDVTPEQMALEALRDSIVNGLRSQGWARIDAETEAEDRIERAALRNQEHLKND